MHKLVFFIVFACLSFPPLVQGGVVKDSCVETEWVEGSQIEFPCNTEESTITPSEQKEEDEEEEKLISEIKVEVRKEIEKQIVNSQCERTQKGTKHKKKHKKIAVVPEKEKK